MNSKAMTRKGRKRNKSPPPSKRISPENRREQILDAAVQHFAEHGFDGATRGIAQRLGVTQPLVYRYFPSKEGLIKEVYERIYIKRWREEWITLVTDHKLPLRERLIEFYCRYTSVVFETEWIRIYVFSALRGLEIHRWWLAFIEDHILSTICSEIRKSSDLPDFRSLAIQPEEFEAYWLFHGGIFYYGMRKQVYGATPRVALDRFIEGAIDNMLQGYPTMLRDLLRRVNGPNGLGSIEQNSRQRSSSVIPA